VTENEARAGPFDSCRQVVDGQGGTSHRVWRNPRLHEGDRRCRDKSDFRLRDPRHGRRRSDDGIASRHDGEVALYALFATASLPIPPWLSLLITFSWRWIARDCMKRSKQVCRSAKWKTPEGARHSNYKPYGYWRSQCAYRPTLRPNKPMDTPAPEAVGALFNSASAACLKTISMARRRIRTVEEATRTAPGLLWPGCRSVELFRSSE